MMKMHGLGNGAYWIVTYVYYLLLYILYIAIFLAVGSAVDLAIFRLTDYGMHKPALDLDWVTRMGE